MGTKGKLVAEYRKNHSAKDSLLFAVRILGLDNTAEDGGPGSGNWGHKGRPGLVGGSGKGGGKQYRGGRADIAFTGSRKDWLNGLSGEKQSEAQKFIKQKQAKIDAAKKIKKLYNKGLITEKERDDALKKGELTEIDVGASPEENIMKSGDMKDKGALVKFVSEARNWNENKDRLIEENLDENEKKLIDYLEKNFAMQDEDGMNAYLDLKAKAMGLPDSGKAIPDEIQYEAGTKERPKPPKVNAKEIKPEHVPPYMKPKPTKKFIDYVNSVEGRDPDVAEIFTNLASIASDGMPEGITPKITYTDKDRSFRYHYSLFTGKLTDMAVRIPKMESEEFKEHEAGATAHELGHFLDFMLRENRDTYGSFHSKYQKEFNDLLSNNKETSDEVKQLFADSEKRAREAAKKVEEEYYKTIDDLNVQIRTALKNPTRSAEGYTKYKELAKKRDAAYRELDKARDNVLRKEMGGVAALEDIYQALGDIGRMYGHKYVTGVAGRMSECWANWCEISLVYPDIRKILEKEKPEFCAIMNKMTKDVLGRYQNGTK